MGFEGVAIQREEQTQRLDHALDDLAGINFREKILQLKRRRTMIVGLVGSLCLLTLIILELIPPHYKAEADVILETDVTHPLTFQEVITEATPDLEEVQDQVAVIQSRKLADKVVRKLALDTLPEFNIDLQPPPFFDPIGWFMDTCTAIHDFFVPPPPAQEDTEAQKWDAILNNFLNQLEVLPKGANRVIQINFSSLDPALAARVANTLADLYINDQLESRFEATQRATNWINDHISALREKTIASEQAVEEFRKQSGLLEGDRGVTLASDEISQIDAQLIQAHGIRADAEARLRQAEQALSSTDGGSMAVEVLRSDLINRLKGELIDLQQQEAQLLQKYGPKYPQVMDLKAQIGDLQTRIRAEVEKIVGGVRNELGVARAQETMLQADLDRLKQRAGKLGQASVALNSLQAEADSNRTLLTVMLQRFNETNLQEGIQSSRARILSLAPEPIFPSSPRKLLILAITLFLSTIMAIMLALALESADRGFRSVEQLARMTNLPALGMIPSLSRWQRRRMPPSEWVLEKPRSAFSEAITAALAGLFLAGGERRPKSVLITSSVSGEGKTTLALTLARAAAMSGMKTLLIDADLRCPTLHEALRFEIQPGLVDILAGKATLNEALRRDRKSTLDVLAAGSAMPNTLQILAADKTRAFFHSLTGFYDLVVVDSSPVMAVTDSRILSRYVDQTLFTVRWGETPREQAILALKKLLDSGAHIGGVLLSMVQTQRHAQYGFGDSGVYQMAEKYYQT